MCTARVCGRGDQLPSLTLLCNIAGLLLQSLSPLDLQCHLHLFFTLLLASSSYPEPGGSSAFVGHAARLQTGHPNVVLCSWVESSTAWRKVSSCLNPQESCVRHLPGASPCARLEMVYAESATDQPVVTGSRRQAGRRPDRALRSGFLSRSGRAEAPRRAISPGEALTAPLASSFRDSPPPSPSKGAVCDARHGCFLFLPVQFI